MKYNQKSMASRGMLRLLLSIILNARQY